MRGPGVRGVVARGRLDERAAGRGLELGQVVLPLLRPGEHKVLALGAEVAHHVLEVGVELDALPTATTLCRE
jgi:hypothetical protein